MAQGNGFRVEVRGLNEVLRALDRLPKQARDEMRQYSNLLARDLANSVRAAGRADSRQSARAARTVRATQGLKPGVVAGPHPLLFGSEFGATRRFGWYAKPRYYDSVPRQFRPHRGASSYWFFREVERSKPLIDEQARNIGEAIIRDWSA